MRLPTLSRYQSQRNHTTIMKQQDQVFAITASVPPQTGSWSSLPDEIKLNVLSCIMSNSPHPITDYDHMEIFIRRVGPFVACRNRKLYKLAQVAYYNNIFQISIAENPDECYNKVITFLCPRPNIASMIRHLRVTVGAHTIINSQPEYVLWDRSQHLAFLLEAIRPLNQSVVDSSSKCWLRAAPRDNSWQTSFTNLHTLALSFHFFYWHDVQKDDQECCVSPESLEETRLCLADTRTLFHAREAAIDLKIECYNNEESVYCSEHEDLIEHWKRLATK
jgi:hypothetical protein